MKRNAHHLTPFTTSPLLAAGALLCWATPAVAVDLYINESLTQPINWFGGSTWGENPPTYDSTWEFGANAFFALTANITVQLDGSTTIGNLSRSGTGTITLQGTGGAHTLTFDGGTINTSGGGLHRTENGITIQGNYTLENGYIFVAGATDVLAYSGTATLAGGVLDYSNNSASLGSSSNFVVNSGTLIMRQNSATIGDVEMNGGTWALGRTNTSSNDLTITVSSLSGSGGSIITRPQTSEPSSSLLRSIVVDQDIDTTFSGSLDGVDGGARLILEKTGSGALTLAGNITLARETTVSGGDLYINSAVTSFSSDTGEKAINVTDGRLGGIGTITTAGGDSVVVGAGGGLIAGLGDTVGITTFALGSGSLNLSAATAGAGTGWLYFDLGAADTAGVTFDQILLLSGSLDIGEALNLDAFNFTLLEGFGPGAYTLFDTDETIIGTLGTTTGTLGGYDVELMMDGNNLVLTVIPEPGSVALALGILALAGTLYRRRA